MIRPTSTAPEGTPYEEHRRYVLGVLGRRCGWLDTSDREAIFHDAYAVFLEKSHDGALDVAAMRPAQVRAYLTQTALNKSLDEGKRAGRRRSVPMLEEIYEVSDPESQPEDALAERLDRARVREIVAELPERQQQIVALRFFFDRTPEQIQGYLGVTERVYRRELERGMRRIGERFALVRDGTFCEARKSLIRAYVAGIAGPNRRVEARRHLESCPGCAHYAAELRIAARRVGAAVPPVTAVPAVHGLMHSVAHATRHRATHALTTARDHAHAVLGRVDASPTALLTGSRPGAIAATIAGCLTIGSGATYCVVSGVPNTLRSLIGATEPRHASHHMRRSPRPKAARVASSPIASWKPPPRQPHVALPAAPSAGAASAARPGSAHAAGPVRSRAQRVSAATAPEFGLGGQPAAPSRPQAAAASANAHSAATTSAPVRSNAAKPGPASSAGEFAP